MILVVGGAGYIGSHFVKHFVAHRLKSQDHSPVIVLDNFSYGHKEALDNIPQVQLVEGDSGDRKVLTEIFTKYPVSAVVHFAADAYVGESQELPFKYFNNNVVKTLNLFECMEEFGIRKIVFSSSCATYGVPIYNPLDEQHHQKPVNVYGLTKLMVEQILQKLTETKKWSYVSLRYFNAAGAAEDGSMGESHNPETHLIPRVLQAARGSLPEVEIHGGDYETKDGTCIRDYIHVFDLADAHINALALVANENVSMAINLGSAVGMSVRDIISKCAEVTGREIKVSVGPRRFGDPPVLIANYDKAEALLAWKPTRTLDDIITSAWAWEQNRRY